MSDLGRWWKELHGKGLEPGVYKFDGKGDFAHHRFPFMMEVAEKTPADVKAFYEQFKAQGVPIDHCVSHAYEEMGNTVSCYFLDPEGNRLEIYALVPERDEKRINRPLDLDQSLDNIVAQASGLPATSH